MLARAALNSMGRDSSTTVDHGRAQYNLSLSY